MGTFPARFKYSYYMNTTSTTTKVHYFSAGPAILQQEVLAEAENAVRDFEDMGLSILEVSHHSKQFATST